MILKIHQAPTRLGEVLAFRGVLVCVFLVTSIVASSQSLDGDTPVCPGQNSFYYFTPPGAPYTLQSATWSITQGTYSTFSPSGNNLTVVWTSGPGTVVVDYVYYEQDVPGVYYNGSLNLSVTVAAPTAYTIGGGGSYCSGATGPTVTLNGSQSGVTYQLKVNGVNSGSFVYGTGSALSWTNQTTAGTYTVVATMISGGCSQTMNGSASVTSNPLPTQFTVSGGGAYCSGSTGPTVTLSSSSTGVNYQLKVNGANSGSPVAGTGASLNWTNQATAGSYTVVATNASTSCTQTMSGSATVTQNSLPAPYTVSGGGTICYGAAGVTVTLSGSASGVNYQLKINGTNSGSAVAGTGAALNWTNQTTAGSYTVVATIVATGCSQTMTGSATVTVNPLPTLYNMGGGGGYCSGGTGVNVTLSGSQTGVNYQLKIGGTNSGSPVAGTGSLLTWANQTTAGTYTVLATNATTACAQTMTGSVAVSVNPLPSLFTVSGGGTICSGAGATITLSGSTSGVNYQLKVNGTNTGSAVAGTGAALNWTNQTAAGSYSVVATNATTSCTQTMTGSATVTVNPLPALFTVSGGGTICSGAAGVTVTLSGSASGVNYQLKINGTNSGSAVAGTGAALNWTNQTTAGSYTVVATIVATGCSQTMTGSATVTVNPLPTLYTMGGGGGYCSGGTGVNVTLSGSQTGVNYQLKIGGTNSGSPVAGTGSLLTWANQTTAGTYTVLATNATTACAQTMTGSVAVSVNPLPSLFTVSGGGTICSGATGPTITLSGSTSGVNYQLKVNGTNTGSAVAGTGAALNWTNQTAAGSYTVVATNATTSCTQTMTGSATVTVNPLPALFTVSGGGTICSGAAGVTVTLSGSASGVNYQLKINGTNSGSAVVGTGAALNWTNQTTAGSYTVVATIVATGCSQTMTGSATVTVNPLPTLYNMGGGGGYCSGGTGVNVTLSGSQTGVNYQLKIGGTNSGSPVAGTGSLLTWANQTTAGTYTVLATNATTACAQTMTGSVAVSINPLPTLFTVSGGGTICSGTTGPTITLSSSTSGVNYQLKVGSTNVGAVKPGTGAALTWSNNTTAGTYTVIGTIAATSCAATMTGNAIVTVLSIPNLYTLSAPSGASYCSGGTGVTLQLSSSQSGANYQLKRGSTNVGSAVAGTGSALTWANNTTAGTYSVLATLVSTSCTLTMTGSIVVVVNPLPTLFTVGGAGATCPNTGRTITLTGSQTGVNYQLKLGAANVGSPIPGTNLALSWPNQTAAGTYTVQATNATTACTRTMTGSAVVTVNPLPTLYTVSGGGVICPGGTALTIGLSGSQSGATYQLRVDGVSTGSPVSGTGSALSWTGLSAGGSYTVLATITATTCAQVMTSSATITAVSSSPPTISGPSSVGSSPITLNSSTGAGYTYQWQKDGTNLAGATSSTLEVTDAGEYKVATTESGCQKTSAGHFVSSQAQRYYNGIIASQRWRTDKPFQVAGNDMKGMFTYQYDAKYQLKDAEFAIPDFSLNTFIAGGNQFRVTNLKYDPNGNILSLKRFSETGTVQHDFAYQYNGNNAVLQNNQLKSIPGYATYLYNELGQMTDEDKAGTEPDQYVNYDVTGKVTQVYSHPSKASQYLKVVYTYDDRGFRLAKTNMVGQRTTWYIRDAAGNIVSIYETDHTSGATTQTEIPVYGSGKIGTYYPEPEQVGAMAYELTDHLGNVRALVKEKSNEYIATGEDSNVPDLSNPRVQEMQYFERLFETEVTHQYMNHTPPLPTVATPNKAAYLFWNDTPGTQASDKAIGPSITLKVDAGDTLKLEAYARYERQASYNRNVDLLLLSSLLGNTFVGKNGLDNLSTVSSMFQNGLGAGGFLGDTDPTRPYAYLNYILFDENFLFVDGGAWRVDENGAFDPGGEVFMNFDHVKFANPIITTQKGYVYVWVSNETKTAKVWFDDVKVTHAQGVVTQATDYGAWGDVVRESKTPAESIYRFGYQGQFAEKDDETGWNHFDVREFDQTIGRWTTGDPLGQYYSPYVGMGNYSIGGIDPDGAECKSCPTTPEYDDYRNSTLSYFYSPATSGDGVSQILPEISIYGPAGDKMRNNIYNGQQAFIDHPVTQGTFFLVTGVVGGSTSLATKLATKYGTELVKNTVFEFGSQLIVQEGDVKKALGSMDLFDIATGSRFSGGLFKSILAGAVDFSASDGLKIVGGPGAYHKGFLAAVADGLIQWGTGSVSNKQPLLIEGAMEIAGGATSTYAQGYLDR
ncbi:MAG: hypothetical protein JNL40_01730 [Cyclobacteriaceae bacterium]|nr:hypothetical protein [Cyclobacteriaceae bacterium]